MIDGLGFASLNLDILPATRLSGSIFALWKNRSPQSLPLMLPTAAYSAQAAQEY